MFPLASLIFAPSATLELQLDLSYYCVDTPLFLDMQIITPSEAVVSDPRVSIGSPRRFQRQHHWLRRLRRKLISHWSNVKIFAYKRHKQDSSYGNDSLSSGANPGSGLGRDQFNDSSNYNQGGAYQGGALGSDDIASRGNNSGSGFGSSGDNYDSSNTGGYGSSGNDNFGTSGLHHQPSATGSFGDDDLVSYLILVVDRHETLIG